jgi:flagellar hook-length control protein FliK
MQVTSQTLGVVAPVSAARPTEPSAQGGAFAHLLRQSQAPTAAPHHPQAVAEKSAEKPAENTAVNDETGSEGAAPDSQAPARPGTPTRARSKTPEKAASSKPAESSAKAACAAEPENKTAANDKTEEPAAKRSADAVASPTPGASPPSTPRPIEPITPNLPLRSGAEAVRASALDTAAGVSDDDRSTAAPAGHEPNERAGSRPTVAAAGAPATTPHFTASSPDDTAAALQATRSAHEESTTPRSAQTDRFTSTTALGAAAFNPIAGRPREADAPLSVKLPTPLASPEFAQALGVQMSVLATDGVQRAELQLNPAEMGPVSVQIVIDGTRAQVDFGADMAATRQAIEAGLPELAGALRDAGFTLTGGGVSQHSSGRSDAHGGAGDGSSRGAYAAGGPRSEEANVRVLRRGVPAGRIDLYA